MEELKNSLIQLKFTKYEADLLTTLIKFEELDAMDLAKYSGVPQPKVYENMIKLEEKGLIQVLPIGKKKFYKTRAKAELKKYFSKQIDEFRIIENIIHETIDDQYHTAKVSDIPFIGTAGENPIKETLIELIEQAKKTVISFLPPQYYSPEVLDVLKKARTKHKKEIKIILHDAEEVEILQNLLPNIDIFQLETPAFEIIKMMMGQFYKKSPVPLDDSFAAKVLLKVAENLRTLFGLVVVDKRRSFFLVPIPVDFPMAIVSTHPQIVDFHSEGIEQILKTTKKVEKK